MSKIIRTTTAEWEESNDKGEVVSKTISVQYNGLSIKDIKQYDAELKTRITENPNTIIYSIIDTLIRRVHRLPDLLGNKPLTVEWLEEQDLQNLTKIREAIYNNDNPEKK